MTVHFTCTKKEYNSNMGSFDIYSDNNTISFFDKYNWIYVGDFVTIEKNEKGFAEKVWVNGILKTQNFMNLLYPISY